MLCEETKICGLRKEIREEGARLCSSSLCFLLLCVGYEREDDAAARHAGERVCEIWTGMLALSQCGTRTYPTLEN